MLAVFVLILLLFGDKKSHQGQKVALFLINAVQRKGNFCEGGFYSPASVSQTDCTGRRDWIRLANLPRRF